MKRFAWMLVLGSLFAALGEYLFCVLVRHSVGDYLFTLAAYPILLALAWGPTHWIERRLPTRLQADLAIYLLAGLAGLATEWFAIGNSPWANPEANDLGMFCSWATVLAMPRLLLDRRAHLRRVRSEAAIAFLLYAALALAIGYATPESLRLFVLVWTVVLGYAGMSFLLVCAFILEWRHGHEGAKLLQDGVGA